MSDIHRGKTVTPEDAHLLGAPTEAEPDVFGAALRAGLVENDGGRLVVHRQPSAREAVGKLLDELYGLRARPEHVSRVLDAARGAPTEGTREPFARPVRWSRGTSFGIMMHDAKGDYVADIRGERGEERADFIAAAINAYAPSATVDTASLPDPHSAAPQEPSQMQKAPEHSTGHAIAGGAPSPDSESPTEGPLSEVERVLADLLSDFAGVCGSQYNPEGSRAYNAAQDLYARLRARPAEGPTTDDSPSVIGADVTPMPDLADLADALTSIMKEASATAMANGWRLALRVVMEPTGAISVDDVIRLREARAPDSENPATRREP